MNDSTKALVMELRCAAENTFIAWRSIAKDAADTIERLEGELRLADAIITREGNRNDALNACKDRCERLLGALVEAERGFDLAYDAAEKGLTDEVLLHCGAHSALISTALFQTAIKRRKSNEI